MACFNRERCYKAGASSFRSQSWSIGKENTFIVICTKNLSNSSVRIKHLWRCEHLIETCVYICGKLVKIKSLKLFCWHEFHRIVCGSLGWCYLCRETIRGNVGSSYLEGGRFRIRSRKGAESLHHRLCSYTAGIAEGNDVVVGVGSIEFVFIRAERLYIAWLRCS